MAFDSALVDALFASVVSEAQRLGIFTQVIGHEPKNAPPGGLSCACWWADISPARTSGLASTDGRVEFAARVYSNMLQEPQDGIDPDILSAVGLLIGAYTDGFTLGGTVMEVDLLGAYGDALSAKAGYINHDNRLFRIGEITVPVIVNDLWTQAS